MGQWTIEESRKTTATPEAIWALWATPATWPLWDQGVAMAQCETEFIQGAFLLMKPVSGPKVRCQLTEVTPLRSFTTLSRLPFTTLAFVHSMHNGVVTHRVEMNGLLCPLFQRILGKDIQQGLPHTITTLIAMAEKA